ncbi:hypothetical protein ACVDG8_000565 [Mesorhizobium sp. ORM8.1]
MQLTRLMVLGLLLGSQIPESASASNDRGLHARRVDECRIVKKDAPDAYCDCIVKVSEGMTDNDPMLELFLASNDKAKAETMYEDLINGGTYKQHNFSSKQEKKDYVAGRATLFIRRTEARCGARE